MSIRVAIIGNNFGGRFVAPAYESLKQFEVADVVSARDEKACLALIRRTDIDLVSVHSPVFMHFAHVMEAIDSGHHVFCDKPLGRAAEESRQMAEAATRASCLGFVNFEFRHLPVRRRLASFVERGALGAIEHIAWQNIVSQSRHPLRRHSWVFEEELGGGWLRSWGAHAIDGVHQLAGRVVTGSTLLRTVIAERPNSGDELRAVHAEDGFCVVGTTTTGATFDVDATFAAAVTLPERLTVLGSSGVAELTGLTSLRIEAGEESGTWHDPEGEKAFPIERALRSLLSDVGDALLADTQIAPSFEDGSAVDRALEALRRASPPRPLDDHNM